MMKYTLHGKAFLLGNGNRMQLREALDHLAVIRQRLAESELFRGYRALPVALSGLFAIIAAIVQPIMVPQPTQSPLDYVLFWSVIAAMSLAAAGSTMVLRDCFAGCSHTRAVTWLAIRQFVPSLIAGCGVTVVIVRHLPHEAWLLPGLWAIFFSQGIFASSRLLPRPIFATGIYYLIAGLVVLGRCRDEWALSPWAMAVPFGIGQLFVAAVLYWTLERSRATPTTSNP